MAKRKISLIGLVVVMICVLVFAPVVTAGIYFIHTVSGQLQHTASETVSMYLNEFTDRTDRPHDGDPAGWCVLPDLRPCRPADDEQQQTAHPDPDSPAGAEFQPRILARAIRSTPMWSAPST